MRTVKVLLIIGVFSVLLSGCGHEHVFKDATCTEPRTCVECGKTEGEPAGHLWNDATCKEPKTCKICGATEGGLADHTWVDADCVNPKTCSVCGLTEGAALGHEVEMGICHKCGETVGEEYLRKISSYMKYINLYADSATKLINEADFTSIYSLYAYFDGARTTHIKNLKDELDDLITYCGSHSELNDIKNAARKLKNKLPSSVSQNKDSLNAFYNDYGESLKLLSDLFNEIANFIDRYTE